MEIVFHYPPQLLSLLIDTIPCLCRSKNDVLLFFKGAGVGPGFTSDLQERVRVDRASIGKHEIARTVLTRLNERGEASLRERREILKRVVEFEDFATCWAEDQLKAKGLVADIRKVIDVKDSFTRMAQEQETLSRKHRDEVAARQKELQRKKTLFEGLRKELFGLFSDADPWARGKKLESVLNRLFGASDILVREAFTIRGDEAQGIVEQIDGVVEIDGHLYLVEMKWWTPPLGPGDVAQHQVRVFNRGQARGIFISASGYTPAAIDQCRDSLARATFILCELQEIVRALETDLSLPELFRRKIRGAIIDKQPLTPVS